MKHTVYVPNGVCSSEIVFDITDDKKIVNVSFLGGCNGNLKAISKLIDGNDALEVASILKGNECKTRGTSCADQLSKAILNALNEK